MEDFNTYEYAATQKVEGKWLLYRILLISLYVIYTAAYFIIIFVTRMLPLGALIPVTLWIIIFFTWRYVKPDYKYTIESGTLTFTVIYVNKTKRKKTVFKVSSAEKIAPVRDILEDIKAFSPELVYSALPSAHTADAHAALYKNSDGKRCIFYFVATAQALNLMRFYNSRTIVTKTAK